MTDLIKAIDDLYRMELERIENGPFIWVGNRNFIEAVRGRMDEDAQEPAQ